MIASAEVRSPVKSAARPRWSILALLFLLVFDVWYRAATFGPTLVDVRLWLAGAGPSEPLDCDEAAYAYIGHRLIQGDVMYRDLTENKPPLGYWLYELAVRIGGYNELAIRLMPIPFVLATIGLLWWIAGKLAGPLAACLAAFLYILLSTDPYLFGNGSNMEHFMNFFSVASLAFLLKGRTRERRWALAVAGIALGAAALVKQVAILPVVMFFPALAFSRQGGADHDSRTWRAAVGDLLAFSAGLAGVIGVAALVLTVQGAGRDAYVDILRYGRALATDTLPEPGAPSALVRWLTGNADPSGKLPWPFGTTNYLVWWGTGSWPLWLAAVPCVIHLLLSPSASTERRIVAGWTAAAALEVVLPGLYWQHYYLLPTPGIALAVAVALGDCVAASLRREQRGTASRLTALAGAMLLVIAAGWTTLIQVRSYLLVPAQELTVRYKGGGQWVALRALGKELARRSAVWDDPHLYIWGWQSPLHFYGKLDGVTRHFFVDNLLRDQAERGHPLIAPRIAEIEQALRERRPAMIFAGYKPFPALRAFLLEHYLPSRLVPSANRLGLWIDREHYAAFESYPAARPSGRS